MWVGSPGTPHSIPTTQTPKGKFRLLLHLFQPPPSWCFIHSCLLATGVSLVMHWQDVSCLLTFYGKLTHHQPLKWHMRLLPAALSLCPASSLQFPFSCSTGSVATWMPSLPCSGLQEEEVPKKEGSKSWHKHCPSPRVMTSAPQGMPCPLPV